MMSPVLARRTVAAARVAATPWVYDDGGRAFAGFKGTAGDCGARALAIASGLPYRRVYDLLADAEASRGKPRSARDGVSRKAFAEVATALGFEWTATMRIGSGCQVHLRADELPAGRLVVALSKHWAAVIGGVVHDTHDPSRDGTRCVYGYWAAPDE